MAKYGRLVADHRVEGPAKKLRFSVLHWHRRRAARQASR